MTLDEAIKELKKLNDKNKKLRGSRWWTREFVYYDNDKFFMENGIEFGDYERGSELYNAPNERYYIE